MIQRENAVMTLFGSLIPVYLGESRRMGNKYWKISND